MLAGYRIVRKLGEGQNAEVWLGRGGETSVAIKVYRATADMARRDAEIDALGRISHRHVVRLDELATGEGGEPVLILQRLTTTSVGRLLGCRRPSLGEATTILAPIALAIAELHRSGVAHGGLRPSSILFDGDGAPVLSGFGSSVVFGDVPDDRNTASVPPALLAREPAVTDDLTCLVELCRAVLGDEGAEVLRWLDGEPHSDAHVFPAQLADRLFSLAAGVPVAFPSNERRNAPRAVTTRIDLTRNFETVSDALDSSGAGAARRPFAEVLAVLHIPDAISEAIQGVLGVRGSGSPDSSWRSRLGAALRPVRTPVWIMAGAVVVAVVAFAAVLPAAVPSANFQARADGKPAPLPTAVKPADPAIAGDDPIAAGIALLRARAKCFAANSVLCLDRVDQAGSTALEADSYRVRLQQSGGVSDQSVTLSDALQLTLVERLGDTALLSAFPSSDMSTPLLSILIIVGDDGWRIRDLDLPTAESG